MRETLVNATIGDIVAGDFRTAGVFERFGIDFCCGGRKSLVEACRTASADPDAVVRELEALHIHLENNVLFPKAIALENGSWRYDGR